MARTAPAPNIPPIPGMCPGIAVLGGGGGGGGGSGKGSKKGKGKKKGKTKKGKKNASGNKKKGGKGKGDPVCPVTGRVFTDVLDFALPGPMPLSWIRSYSSRSTRDGELGIGWSHAHSWTIVAGRRRVTVIDDAGLEQEFEDVPETAPVQNGLGWSLRREGAGFRLSTGERTVFWFGPAIDRRHRLIGATDVYGNRISFERDLRGALTRIVDSAGRPIHVTTDHAGRITSMTVPRDATGASGHLELVRYTYDELGRLTSATDAGGNTFRNVYAGTLLVEHQVPTGLSYFYRYDGTGADAYCVESWGNYRDGPDPALAVQPPFASTHAEHGPIRGINYVRFEWVKEQNYSEMADGRGGITRHFGDEAGRVVKEVDAMGGVTEYGFDEATGEPTYERLPDGSERAARVDEFGLPYNASSSAGEATQRFIYEGVEWQWDMLRGAVTRRTYDLNGNETNIHHPDNTIETYEWDERGLARQSVNRRGAITQFIHDAMGNLIEERGPRGPRRFEYDYLGRCIAREDESGRTEWQWDDLFEISGVRFPDGRSMFVERDALRNITRVVDGRREWQFEYGGIHWLTKITTNAGRVVEIKYDVEGDVVSVRNARGQTLEQRWDSAGRCVECVTYEGVVCRAGYDATGQPVWVEGLRGAREERAYKDDDLAEVALPDGAIALSADPKQRSVTIDDGVVTLRTIYDPLQQPVFEEQGEYSTKITWDGGGIREVVSSVGTPLRFDRRADGRVSQVLIGGMGALRIDERTPTGWVTRLGDNLALRRLYNENGALIWQGLARVGGGLATLDGVAERGDPNLIAWRAYDWDQGVLRIEQRSDGSVLQYDVDADYQVRARRVLRGGVVAREELWGYDAGGSPIRPGVTYDEHYRPIQVGNERLEYDAYGFLVARERDEGTTTYEWNGAGELVAVHGPTSDVELTYDGKGRRVRKQVFVEERLVRDIRWVWAENVVLHEVDAIAETTRTFIREDDRWNPLVHVDLKGDQRAAYFYVQTPIGTVDFVVDAHGKVAWDADHGVFGEVEITRADVQVDYRLPNQQWDEDVGLSYNFQRWYDPRFGLFVSPDPELLGGSLNPRDIAFNPTVAMDPLGLAPLPANFGQPNTPTSTLVPGPFAAPSTGTVPGFVNATNPAFATPGNPTGNFNDRRGFPVSVKRAIDAAGKKHGCHTCGKKNPGKGKKHFVPDHQPPISSQKAWSAANGGAPFPGPVNLYPHCRNCSQTQAGQQSALAQGNPAGNVQAAQQTIGQAAGATPSLSTINTNAANLGVTNGF